jgi:hypothetical protein
MLRTRLFLYLTPFVIILLAGGAYAIVLFARLANSVDASVTNNYQSFTAASAMSLALAGMDREVSWSITNATLIKTLLPKTRNVSMKTSICCSRPARCPAKWP